MENNQTIRTIDELGRVVLPREVRENLGWKEKTKVEVKADKERNEVILKRASVDEEKKIDILGSYGV